MVNRSNGFRNQVINTLTHTHLTIIHTHKGRLDDQIPTNIVPHIITRPKPSWKRIFLHNWVVVESSQSPSPSSPTAAPYYYSILFLYLLLTTFRLSFVSLSPPFPLSPAESQPQSKEKNTSSPLSIRSIPLIPFSDSQTGQRDDWHYDTTHHHQSATYDYTSLLYPPANLLILREILTLRLLPRHPLLH